jgi:hypothetical protein
MSFTVLDEPLLALVYADPGSAAPADWRSRGAQMETLPEGAQLGLEASRDHTPG